MTFIDYFIIGAYMLGILAVGLLSKGKEDSAEDYFAAGGRMGGLLSTVIVGLSIAATFFSGLSFVAVPSIIISDGLKVTLVLVTLPISSWIVCGWFIPRYLALKTLHPYEIIRRHIGSRASNVTSALFVLLRVGWMAALLYAPTILLLTTMRLGDQWLWPLILVMGSPGGRMNFPPSHTARPAAVPSQIRPSGPSRMTLTSLAGRPSANPKWRNSPSFSTVAPPPKALPME